MTGLGLGRGVGTPEQYQRSSKADNGGKPIVWEACQTLNNSWGYDRGQPELEVFRDGH